MLYNKIEKLILEDKVHTFLFKNKSQFDDLSHKIVTELKEKYSHIKIYVVAEFSLSDNDYIKL